MWGVWVGGVGGWVGGCVCGWVGGRAGGRAGESSVQFVEWYSSQLDRFWDSKCSGGALSSAGFAYTATGKIGLRSSGNATPEEDAHHRDEIHLRALFGEAHVLSATTAIDAHVSA